MAHSAANTQIMNTKSLLTLGVVVLLVATGSVAPAQEAKESKEAAPAKPKLNQEELEAKFKATLTKATMSGRWCGIKDGKLTPEKEDKYTIVSVNKLGGEAWIIHEADFGDETGNAYIDTVLIPVAASRGAEDLFYAEATGTVPASTPPGSFEAMPIRAVIVATHLPEDSP